MDEAEMMDMGSLVELSALYEISSIPTSLISHEELGRLALDKVTRLLGVPVTLLYRWEGDDRSLRFWAARGIAEVEDPSPEEEAIARALKEGRPVVLEGENAVRALGVLPANYPACQGLCLPIRTGISVKALLLAFRMTDRPFARADLKILNVLAERTGTALETLRLFAETEQRQRELEQEIAERERVEVALEKAYAEVERRVEERTAELQREIVERERAQEESARLQQEVIEAQQRMLQELSTPIIPIMERIVVMPLIGSIDSMRARDITRSLLAGIRDHRAKVVILDITGVPIVDSGVASHLSKTIQAARLKGARTIVTGISDPVAETIVALGIDWSEVETLSDLQTGLIVALNSLGFKLTR